VEHYQNEFVLHGGIINKNSEKTRRAHRWTKLIGEDADIQSTSAFRFKDKIETQDIFVLGQENF
jgi:hypothetical protein